MLSDTYYSISDVVLHAEADEARSRRAAQAIGPRCYFPRTTRDAGVFGSRLISAKVCGWVRRDDLQ